MSEEPTEIRPPNPAVPPPRPGDLYGGGFETSPGGFEPRKPVLTRARWWLDRKNPFLTINQRRLRDAYAWAMFLGFLSLEIIGIVWVWRKLL